MKNASVSLPKFTAVAEDQNCLTELDARAPTPPNHLKAILAAMALNPKERPQFVRTNSRPVDWLDLLAAQGITADARPLTDGTWRTVLRR